MFHQNEENLFEENETLKQDLVLFEDYMHGASLGFMDSDRLEALVAHYVMNNQHQHALWACQHGTEQFPYNIVFRILKAQTLLDMGREHEASAILSEVELMGGERFDFLTTKAILCSRLRDHKAAIRCLHQALAHATDTQSQAEVLMQLAMEYIEVNNFQEAIKTLIKAKVMHPENVRIAGLISECYERKGMLKESIQTMLDFLDIDPYSANGWYILGDQYFQSGEYEKAIEAYQYSVAIDETFDTAYFNLGTSYVEIDLFNEAIQAFQKSLELNPNDAITMCRIGECYEELEDIELAEHYFRKCLQIDPQHAYAWVGLGIVEELKGNRLSGISLLKKANSLLPNDSDILYMLAHAHYRAEMIQPSLECFQQALFCDPTHQDAFIDYACVVTEYMHPPYINNKNEWLSFIEEYPTKYGENPMVEIVKIDLFWQLQRYDEAIAMLQQCAIQSTDQVRKIFRITEDATLIEVVKKLIEVIQKEQYK